MKNPISYSFLDINPTPEEPKIEKNPQMKNIAPHVFKSESKKIFGTKNGDGINEAYNKAISEQKKGNSKIFKGIF